MKVKVLFVSKKNMKGDESMKIKSLLSGVCVVAISLALPCRADYTCVTNGFSFNYTVNADGQAVIQHNNSALFKGEELLVPAQLDGRPVVSLGGNAFSMVTNSYYETKRGRAFVENGPQEIGHAAFYTDGPGWDVVCVPGSVTRFSGAWCFRKVGKVYWTISSETLKIDQHAFSIAPYELRIVATCGVPNELHDKCYLWDCFGYYSSGYSGQTYYKCKKEHFEAWVARGGLDRFRGYVDDGYEYGKEAIVTFNVNGGDPLPSKTYRQGSPYAVLPTPTKLGYSFQGWRTVPYSEAGQEDGFAVGTDDVVAAPRETLYATWTPLPTCEVDDGTGGSGGKDSRFSSSGVYDGQGHGITVKVTSVANPKIAYSLAKTGPYVGSLLLTNACDATAIWYTVDASGYNTYTNWATVTITPRPVTLTSESASKKYDGRPLTNGEVLIGGDGFVGNEGVVFDVTGVQTEIGNSKNTFSYTLKPNTRAENYNISKVEGQLSVTDEWGYLAARLFVDAENGNDTNDGTSWSRAKKTIQAAVDVSKDLDTILVADGTYGSIETVNRRIAIRSVNGADRTFIDGGNTNRCAYLGDSTNQVDTLLSGFTLKEGYLYIAHWDPAGAGVRGGFVRNCVITNCFVDGAWSGYGGNGGGAYGSVLEDCRLIANRSLHGGGCFDSIVRRCLIVDNYAKDDAGGSSNCQVFDSVVTRNRSSNIGGGLSGTAFRDCLAYNCTVVSNISTAGAIVGSDLRNCLVTGNMTANGIPDDFRENDESKNILSSCWTNSVSFADATNGDFRFSGLIDEKQDAHPCVNAGDNGDVISGKDLDGNARIFDSVVDIGAYEFRGCTYKLKNYVGVYDGNGHSIQVTPCWPTRATVSYSLTREGPYATEPILMTNVCDPTKIWFAVVAEGHETVTNFGTVAISGIDLSAATVELSETSFVYDGRPKMPTVRVNGEIPEAGACSISYESNKDAGTASVTIKGVRGFAGEVRRSFVITPRPVTLTSKGNTKVYDGTPLTAHEVAVGGDGFVDGEGASYAFTGSQTAVGTSENTFAYTLNENAKAGNYEITTVNGTLTVTKASIGGGEGGGGEPGDGDVPDGGLSKFDATAMYDGEGHTVKTNELQAAFDAAMVGECAVEYAADDGSAGIGGRGAPALPWGAAPAYINVGEYVVWYRVTNPNYEDFVHAAKVTIAKRAVTVRSRNLTKPYDGMPLALTADDIDAALTDGGQGLPALPPGESFVYGGFAERTAAGETPAIFTVSAGADTRLENYDLTTEYGTLTVTRATYPGQEPGGAGIAWSVAPGAATWMYDGRPHGVALTGVPAGVTARLAGHEATDAGDYVATVALDYDAANYEPPAAPAPLAWSIARRPLTLMAASREKPYDGFPLAVRPGDITASGSGYADGECLDYFGFASITDVGETAATFSYRDSATAKAANYDVTVAGGQTLKVTVGGDQISVTADSATWAYDGEEHRAAAWRVGNGDKLLAGHELRVAVDPASVVRTPADGPDGDGVVSNRFASVRIVEAATGADRTRNYNLVLKEGVLRMTNACIRAERVFGADDVAKVYDGVSTQVVVTARLLQPARVRYFADGAAATSAALPEGRGDGAAATSAALPEEVVWGGEPLRFTHATNATVRFTVEADYYNAYTGRVDVAIAKRAVTLTTPTKAKTYDGAPLTFGADEVELVATSATLPEGRGDGAVATSATLPEGESFVFSDFAAITDAGRVPARCAYAAGAGTRLSDYAVTEEWGTLTVLASADEITVTADSATWAYDGTAHRLPSYTAENVDTLQPGDELAVEFAPESVVLTPEDGPDGDGVVSNAIASVRVLRHGTEDVTRNYSLAWYPGVLRVTKARMTFDGEGSVDPSEFSTAATYDGAGHTVAVVPPSLLTAPVTVRYYGAVATSATLPARGDGAVATSATLPAWGDGAVATSATLPEEAAWSGEAPAFTNAGVHTVFYALDARHYETYFGTATVTIAPRPVTLVSDGAEKVYDGTPLRCDAVRVKDGSPGFVDGEGFAATCSGALTDVGAMENLFDYALTGGAKADNYAVTKEYGWLRVTPAPLDPGAVFGGGETDADGGPLCARVYNGAPQPFAPAPDFGEPFRLSYALVPGDESAYSETAPTRTHVAEGDLAVYFKFLSPNYAPYYGKGTLRIVPKALTEEMCVADEDAAWFFDGTEKRPAVTVVDGDPNIATADDYTLAYSGRTGAGLFPVTVTGANDYCGVVTKEFAILKRPVAPPVIPSRAYSGRLQRPTIAADARWTVAANPGGTDAGLYTNVVLRLANTADYKWKGLGGDEADWTGVFEIRKGANGWSTYPGIRSWTNGVEAANEPTGRARFGTLSVAYRRRGAPVASETAERPSAPGRYTARFWVEETKNYAGVGLAAPYDVDFEIFRGPDDPPAGDATTTTPVPVPYAWLDAYVGRFGGGDYEAAAHAPGANGVALWESYVAGLDPADAASRFTASIALGADGTPVVTWSPDLRAAEPPRAYTVYGKPTLGAAAWTPVTDANRAAMRFFKVAVEVR